jgi:hypothetical protein
MKRMFLIATGLFLSVAGFSQFSIGIQGTGNLGSAALKFKDGPTDWKKSMEFTPGGGIVAQIGIKKNFALRTGLLFLQHGVTVNTKGFDPDNGELGEISIEAKNKLNYIQVPLYALYTKQMGGLQFFAGAGPFVNYGVSGVTKMTASYTLPNGEPGSETTETDAFKTDSEDGANFDRTDFGAGALAGIKLSGGLYIQAGYQLGLANITRDEGNKYKTQGIQVSFGYFFR